jgi:hypothetical protein
MSSPDPMRRPIPLLAIIAVAVAVHGPLLLMQLPLNSYDTYFHIFFASHYARHWFNPWNVKWFAGFSQATYPPLPQQWAALFSYAIGLKMAYMLVQMIIIALLPVGVYRSAKLWVDERAASYAALASVFLGSLSFLVYEAGQLSTTAAIPLYLIALPYFYDWSHHSDKHALWKGLAFCWAGAAAHHVTLIFGAVLFAVPVIILAVMDRRKDGEERTVGGILGRAFVFSALAGIGAGLVLLPYFVAFIHNPIKQVPIPHASRSNYLLNLGWGVNYFIVPYGAMLLALPAMLLRGSAVPRLRPLLVGVWVTFIIGLGGTTPLPRWLFGRAYEILTYERFSFWATIMALPLLGVIVAGLVDRYGRRAIVAVSVLAIATCAFAASWTTFHPINYEKQLYVEDVAKFLNTDGHDQYRYLTLGFGLQMSHLAILTHANSVDGDYNSARMLPEMTSHGGAQFTNAKYYGTNGMAALGDMLRHADRYGLKWVVVADPFYEPMLVFAGWRKYQSFGDGKIFIWTKDGVPPAEPVRLNFKPAPWEGLLWGTLPIGSSILALWLVIALPEQKRQQQPLEMPATATQTA